MIRNYIVLAIRNIKRYGTNSFLNLAGLTIALAACLVIYLVVQHEYSFDTYHANAERVYQVVKKEVKEGNEDFYGGIALPAKKALSNDFPTVQFTELFTSFGAQFTVLDAADQVSDKKFLEEQGVFFVDPGIADFFSFSWIEGSPEILSKPDMIALSRSKAIKYFGSESNAVGRSLLFENKVRLQVGAVFADPPANTDFNFQMLPSYATLESNLDLWGYEQNKESWGFSTSNHQVYALLPQSVHPEQVNKQLQDFVKKYYRPEAVGKVFHFLLPLKEIHFDTRFGNNGTHISSKTSLMTLQLIGLLILLMACINFINLSTALAVKRSKEIGIRKVMGSTRGQLRIQLLAETFLLVLFALTIAVLLTWLTLPYLKYITDIQEKLPLLQPDVVVFLLAILLTTVLLSGLYPAFFLSRFNPVEAIKNKIHTNSIAGLSLRRVLVVLQFSFSQLLVIATIIAVSQMNFIRQADLGFNKESTLLLSGNMDSVSIARHNGFKAALQQLPEVKNVSFSMDAPSSDNNWTMNFAFNQINEDLPFDTHIKMADGSYVETFGLKMAAGEFYRSEDSVRKVVINETMVNKLGLKTPEEAVGKTIRVGTSEWLPIAGVVKDFKNNSLRESIKPTILFHAPGKLGNYMAQTNIRLEASNPGQALNKIETVWNRFYPEYAFRASFLDETIQNFYQQEERLSRLYKVFAGLAIIISCLGLYGLISFMAVQKTKEVGIRKVLGASVAHIVILFSKEFTILILIAFAMAAPVAWFLMNDWLQNFVFRVDIGWWIFGTAIVISLFIAWVTVGYKALSAALANPVKSLKTE